MRSELYGAIQLAAEHIELYGLHKGDNYADWNDIHHSSACVLGALNLYLDDWLYMDDVTGHIKEVLNVDSLVVWNDAPERTKEDVVAGLRRAATAT